MKTLRDFIFWEQSSRQTIDFKMVYVDIAGDLIAGLLLSQIIYWNLPSNKGDSKLTNSQNKKLLVKRRSDWYEEIRISEKQYDRAISILENLKLVRVENHKSKFYEGATVPHIELRSRRLIILLNIQSRKLEFPKGQSSNSPKVNPRIDRKVNAIDTETTPKSTTKITKEKSVVPKNEAEEEIKSLLEKDIQLNSSSPNIYSFKNQQDLQTLISEYPLSQIKEAIPKVAKHPRFGKRFSYGGYLMYIRDFLYSKKDKNAQGLSINYFQKPKPRDGEYDGNAHSKMSFAENSA